MYLIRVIQNFYNQMLLAFDCMSSLSTPFWKRRKAPTDYEEKQVNISHKL